MFSPLPIFSSQTTIPDKLGVKYSDWSTGQHITELSEGFKPSAPDSSSILEPLHPIGSLLFYNNCIQHLNISIANFLDKLDEAAGAKQFSACVYVYRITMPPKVSLG